MQAIEFRTVSDPAVKMAQAIDDYLEYLSGGSAGLSYEDHQAIRRQRLADLRRARAAYKAASGN